MTAAPTMISISARLTLNLHDLNNEGSEGNQVQTRMVHVVDENGELAVVNAVSGDMLKHIQAGYLQRVALEEGLPLCAGCRLFDANRINRDEDFFKGLGDEKDASKTLDRVIPACVVDDAEGFLITVGGRSVPRKSTVEFGWLVGIPSRTQTESYFHVKYDPSRGAGSGDETGANLGQAIFYRPANSGVYALVATFEASRIGFNDISREYVLSESERAARVRAVLKSLVYTLVRTEGAQRNTQHPHILAAEGVVAISRDARPAPTASPLKDGYREDVMATCKQLDRMGGKHAFETRTFDSMSEFASIVADLVDTLA